MADLPRFRAVDMKCFDYDTRNSAFRVDDAQSHDEDLNELDFDSYDLVCVADGIAYFQLKPGQKGAPARVTHVEPES